jgi:uncharacterized protein YdcH (DUF465 family)
LRYIYDIILCVYFLIKLNYAIRSSPISPRSPRTSGKIHILKKSNLHFAKLLREYEGLDIEIGRAESDVPGYMMNDLELQELKKQKLHLKDELIAMVK